MNAHSNYPLKVSQGCEQTFLKIRYTNGQLAREEIFSVTSHQENAKPCEIGLIPVSVAVPKR